MSFETGFSLETRLRIAALVSDSGPAKILPKFSPDFPKLLADKQKAELERLDQAKKKLAVLSQNDDEATLDSVFVPGEDTVDLLTLELFGRTGVYVPPTRLEVVTGIKTIRGHFEALDQGARRDYLIFLGGVASSEVDRISEEVEEFHGSYTFDAPLRIFREFVGFTINASIPETADELPKTGS